MGLTIISLENKEQEDNIQKKIFDSIDKNGNIIFSSGAGAGKTYALIESLKYIINQYSIKLKSHNQKIVCITYTNVATEEVKERLGNSDLVKVSTIHERIWELIKGYQNELVVIHKKKLEAELDFHQNELLTNDKFIKYQDLSDDYKKSFQELMVAKKDLFYESQDEKSAVFRKIFASLLTNYPDILKNFTNFKSLVKTIYKIDNYTLCLKNISSEKDKYREVIYNAAYNIDRLHWMRISHDTLLEYGLSIIENHDLLQQIIIDKYPYFLIDEYQDTDKQVIKILSVLSKCSERIKHNFFVGYFGDPAQNIYEDGIGNKISEIHPNLKNINKRYNRRSTKEVIDVINNIRNDEINQVSIYDDSTGGSVNFFAGAKEEIEIFINQSVNDWNITIKNKLHCLVLTNKSVAEYSGFSNIYSFFSKTPKYKKAYQQLNPELLSNDISKLGDVPVLLFRIIEFRNKLLKNTTQVQDILSNHHYKSMDVVQLRSFIELLKEIQGSTLKESLESIQKIYEEKDNATFKSLIKDIYDFDGFPAKSLANYMIELLYPNLDNDDLEQTTRVVEEFLNIDLEEFNSWYKYIVRETGKKIVYHTYHGTKGLEFDNVIILMENAFGRDKQYFNKYFTQLMDKEVSEDYIEKFEHTKNLLYVACSRAVKNLRVLYLDDVSSFNSGIEKIFSKVEEY